MRISEKIIRKLYVNRYGHGNKSYYFHRRLNKWFFCMSDVEKDFLMQTEDIKEIVDIRKEEFIVEFFSELDKKVKRYIPDFVLLVNINGKKDVIVVECKYKKEAKKLTLEEYEKIKKASEILRKKDIRYIVFQKGDNLRKLLAS